MILMSVSMLCSCEHEDVSYLTDEYKIGNIVCSDGSIIHPSLYSSQYRAVGVIFWVNGDNDSTTDKAYAVSLQSLGEHILVPDSLCEDIQNVSSDKLSFNGFNNTVGFQTFMLDKKSKFPAIINVVEYSPYGKKGWYIGSIAQEQRLFESRHIVNETLAMLQGEEVSGDCWSSTEAEGEEAAALYALSLNYNSGNVTPVMKTEKLKIRPFITIDKK